MRRTSTKTTLFLFGAIALAFVFLGVLWIDAWGDVLRLKNRYPVVHDRGRNFPPIVTFEKLKPFDWVSLNQVSKSAVGAILVSEDWAFYQHKGYDPNQIKEAMKVNLKRHKYVRGASTITQQVAKNVFLDREKSLWRKFKELIWAVLLEKAVGKTRILEVYLNIAEWGDGIYGIAPASSYYFEKSPSALDAKEGAFLAMLLPSPIKYSASFRKKQLTSYAQKTIDRILAKMVQAKYLTLEEAREQAYAPLKFEETVQAPIEEVIEQEENISTGN